MNTLCGEKEYSERELIKVAEKVRKSLLKEKVIDEDNL